MGHGGWRRRGTRSSNLLSRFYKLRDFQSFWERTWGFWWHDFLTQEDDFFLQCGRDPTFLFCRLQERGLNYVIPAEGHQGGHSLLKFLC